MDAVRNALITNAINNFFHVVWFICITLEPKYSRKRTIFILAATGVFFQVLAVVLCYSDILGRMLCPVGYFLAVIIFGTAYIFGVSMNPSKSIFLMSAYSCLWAFIYSMVSIVTGSFAGAGNPRIWLLRIGLNLFFLVWYQFFFKKRFLRVYRDIRYGDSSITVLSILTFYMVTLLLFSSEKQHGYSAFYLYILISVYVFVVSVYVVLFRFLERSNHERQFKQMQFHEKLLLAQVESYEEVERKSSRTR